MTNLAVWAKDERKLGLKINWKFTFEGKKQILLHQTFTKPTVILV